MASLTSWRQGAVAREERRAAADLAREDRAAAAQLAREERERADLRTREDRQAQITAEDVERRRATDRETRDLAVSFVSIAERHYGVLALADEGVTDPSKLTTPAEWHELHGALGQVRLAFEPQVATHAEAAVDLLRAAAGDTGNRFAVLTEVRGRLDDFVRAARRHVDSR